jgi:prepilin-type processing-associated H-X9-DG protein
MFGKGILGGASLKLMSAFTAGLVSSTSLFGAETQRNTVVEINKEIRRGGLSHAVSVSESVDVLAGMKKLLGSYSVDNIQEVMDGVKIWNEVSDQMGFADIDGTGFSIVKENDRYLMDCFMHMKKGHENSLLWKILGGQATQIEALELLPPSTILSGTFRLDLSSLWTFLKEDLQKVNSDKLPKAEIDAALQKFEEQAMMLGAPVEDFAKALSTEVTLVVTLDKSRTMQLPNSPQLPGMAVSLIIKNKSDLIQNLLLGFSGAMKPEKSTMGDFSVVTMPGKVPSGTAGGFAYNKDWLILTSDVNEVEAINKAKGGDSLLNSKKFSAYAKMSQKGNSSFYLSGEVYDLLKENLMNMPNDVRAGAASIDYMLFQGVRPELYYVGYKKANGLKAELNSTFNLPQGQMMTVATIGILAAMVLPALGKAREKAKMAQPKYKMAKSKSHLKQMGITVAMYFSDGVSSDFPKDVKKLDFDLPILSHPRNDTPVSVEDIVAGRGDYLFLFKAGDKYLGSSTIPMAMEKPGLWADGSVNVVFQDGHVAQYFGQTVEEVLNKIKASAK